MERSFECPICFDQFSTAVKPLLIPCGHTACESCLSSLARSKQLECPVCRSIHHNLILANLSTNFALIQSDSAKPSLTLIDRLEELHKQQSELSQLKDILQANFEQSLNSISKARTEVHQKQEFIEGLIQSLSKALNTQLDTFEGQVKAKYDKFMMSVQNNITLRSELIAGLEALYSNKEEISAQVRLQLASLTFPKIETSMERYSVKSQQFDFNEKLSSFFGVIETEGGAKDLMMDVDKVERKESDKQPFDKQPFYNKNLEKKSDSNFKARKPANDDKQPRQRPENNVWYVKNRYGKWEKLPPWFDAQLKAAVENQQETVYIVGMSKKNEFFVNFTEKMSYRLSKSGQPGRGNQIVFGLTS